MLYIGISSFLIDQTNMKLYVGGAGAGDMGKLIGCVGHDVGPKELQAMQDSSIFTMSNVRDVADRMVSGFFYDSPHSPPCARKPTVVSRVVYAKRVRR